MSHLHTRLTQIESYANTLEKRVYRKLCGLELTMNEIQIKQEERQILVWLHKLDDLQEEIDGITAKLKAQGLNVVISYEGNVYKAKPKKIKAQPKPKPQKQWSEQKVYPVDSPTPDKLKAKREAAKAEQRAAVEARKAARTEATKLRHAEQLAAQQAAREAREATRRAKQEARDAEKAAIAAEREAAKVARQEALQAEKLARKAKPKAPRPPKAKPAPKPKSVRPPKAKPEPKPRKVPDSYELKLAKKRRDNAIMRLGNLDSQIEQERRVLLKRLEERKARIKAVAHLSVEELGYQKRRNARMGLENVQSQLDGLEQRKQDRFDSLTAQLAFVEAEIEALTMHD